VQWIYDTDRPISTILEMAEVDSKY
jgi:hypothetical protein